jgi:hypothetical protein
MTPLNFIINGSKIAQRQLIDLIKEYNKKLNKEEKNEKFLQQIDYFKLVMEGI